MPTSPVGPPLCRFQSTHPARGATIAVKDCLQSPVISIHAPREGCDGCIPQFPPQMPSISIHAPREGCDRGEHRRCVGGHNFNPRTPRGVRRVSSFPGHFTSIHFNPRTPRGVRRCPARGYSKHTTISIHAPREGCDALHAKGSPGHPYFNPRTPRGVRRGSPTICKLFWHFNPRTPRGVRRGTCSSS